MPHSAAPTYRIAHLTDPHVGPLPRMRLRQLLSKRLTGYVNWHRGRRRSHDMALLSALVADLKTLNPDHVACTGDVSNLGLPAEWPTARLFMDELGPARDVSFVPGNHDAYVMGSLEGLLKALEPFTTCDEGSPLFPYIRRRGRIAFVGLSSAIPTLPFVASGKLGKSQVAKAEEILARLGREGMFRVVLIHHPPHVGGAPGGRNLIDAAAFEGLIARAGAELVLHGHNHTGSLAWLEGPGGTRVPVFGAPSASARGGTLTHKAGYHLYEIGDDGRGFWIKAQLRGLREDGTVGDCGYIPLNRGRIRR